MDQSRTEIHSGDFWCETTTGIDIVMIQLRYIELYPQKFRTYSLTSTKPLKGRTCFMVCGAGSEIMRESGGEGPVMEVNNEIRRER